MVVRNPTQSIWGVSTEAGEICHCRETKPCVATEKRRLKLNNGKKSSIDCEFPQ